MRESKWLGAGQHLVLGGRVYKLELGAVITIIGALVLASLPATAVKRLYKDEDTRRLEREVAEAEEKGASTFAVASRFLEDPSVSAGARSAALQVVERAKEPSVDTYLERVLTGFSSANPSLARSIELALLRRGLRKCGSEAAEIEFLRQELREAIASASFDDLQQWLAEELCDRGAGTGLGEIETVLTRSKSDTRLAARWRLCQQQVELLAGGRSRLEIFKEVLGTEDLTPGMQLHEWAVRFLLKQNESAADEVVLAYALRLQTADWPRARNAVWGLKAKGWSEEELAKRGWHGEMPGVHALRSRNAPEGQ